MNTLQWLGAAAAGLTILAASAMPARAQAEAGTIRPTKMLSVESAGTLPEGANLVSISGSDLQYYRGLTDRVQLEVGTSGLHLLGPTNLGLRAQAKVSLFELGFLGVGAGLGATTHVVPTIAPNYGGAAFLPLSMALLPGLDLNVVPRFGVDTGYHTGVELGLAYALAPDVVAIAEDHMDDFANLHHDVLVGGAYTGFGPRTTLAFGLLSGDGTAENPYGFGLGATLHHGF